MGIRHLAWDWNGTLLKDTWLCLAVLNDMLEARSMPTESLEAYRDRFHFPVKAYYELLGFDLNSESFEAVGREFIDAYEARRADCQLHGGSREVLQLGRERASSQSILSAYEQGLLESALEHFGVAGFVDHAHGHSDVYAPGKLASGQRLLERVGCKAEEMLLIGDTLHDAEVADALGMACLLVSHGHHSHERLAKSGYPVVDSLDAVAEHLCTAIGD